MLHLSTRNGPTLMEMIANVVRNESELLVILMGRVIEPSLAGLLHHADNDADGTESHISSMTVSSMAAPSIPVYIPLPSGMYSYHELHANEETASQEDYTSLGRLRRQIAALSWGVRSQISSGTGILSLPCDSDLVSLMACASAVTPSEMDEKDGAVGELGGGTTTGDDEFDDSQLSAYIDMIYDDKSSISSLTLPTLKLSSSSRSEAASDVIDRSRPSDSARDSAGVSHTMPTGQGHVRGLRARQRVFLARPLGGRSSTSPATPSAPAACGDCGCRFAGAPSKTGRRHHNCCTPPYIRRCRPRSKRNAGSRK